MIKPWQLLTGLLLSAGIMGSTPAVQQRDYIMIVGSSTAFPIVSAVVERFVRKTGARSPVVEAMGTGGGFRFFCDGAGLETPDIAMASRKLNEEELKQCESNGIDDPVQVKIGYDGIVFVSTNDAETFDFSSRDLYLALAREIPDPSGRAELVSNPYSNWNEISESLPAMPIKILGPPLSSGTRDILVEKLMEQACADHAMLRDMRGKDSEAYNEHCYTFREDGAYINAGENDARIVRKLSHDPGAIGILGYNFLERNGDLLNAASIDSIAPEFEMIENSSYPLSRPLYLYIKREHYPLVNGLSEFLSEFTSDAAWGDEGYLVDKGLIPLSAEESSRWRERALPGI
ncbi:substrate-binding domain-containing protein [Solemya velum gill symbiont]|nr:substrate-binding domain-containing protein [Solemya velum gill symbiont]